MTVSRRDRWLGRYAYATLDTSVGAIVANSRDRVARLLGLATLSKGGGVIFTNTVMRDSRVMRDSLRMTDRG